jgi:hypothetical protein
VNVSCRVPVPSTTVGMSILYFGYNILILGVFLRFLMILTAFDLFYPQRENFFMRNGPERNREPLTRGTTDEG